MKPLTPIETFYKGYRFRSRLEARWAVFFDALSIDWEYEPEAFDLGGIGYLPDFLLRTDGDEVFAEVKPAGGDDAFVKPKMLANAGRHVLLLAGPPESRRYPFIPGERSSLSFSTQTLGLTFAEGFTFAFNHGRDTSEAVAAARSARFEQNHTAAESLRT